MALEPVIGKIFGPSDTVTLDGRRFLDCRFEGCILEFDGYLNAENCTFKGCTFSFGSRAQGTISLLGLFWNEPALAELLPPIFEQITGSAKAARKMLKHHPSRQEAPRR